MTDSSGSYAGFEDIPSSALTASLLATDHDVAARIARGHAMLRRDIRDRAGVSRLVVELTEWLRSHNRGKSQEQAAGFYGLDVYSLWDSMREVMARTVFWKLRFEPLRSEPRRMLSCFEGTQAVAPSGDSATAPR